MKKEKKSNKNEAGVEWETQRKWMWEVWIKIESRHEALWWGKKAMSNLHDIDNGMLPILLPWRFPGHQIPALTSYTPDCPLPVNPSLTDLYTGTSKESSPILNSPPTYNSSTVPISSIPLILQESGRICLVSPKNWTWDSAVGVRLINPMLPINIMFQISQIV